MRIVMKQWAGLVEISREQERLSAFKRQQDAWIARLIDQVLITN